MRGQPYFKSQKTTIIAQTSFSSFKPNPSKQPCLSLLFCQPEKKIAHFCMLQVWRHVLPHNTIRFYCFTFALVNMFLKVVNFGNQKFFSPFDLCAHPTFKHMHFPIKAKKNFCPWKLYCPIIFKNLLNSFPIPFTLLFLFSFSTRITSSNGF